MSVWKGSLCLCEGKRFYHGMNFAYGLVCFAMLGGCLGFQRPRRLDSDAVFVNFLLPNSAAGQTSKERDK